MIRKLFYALLIVVAAGCSKTSTPDAPSGGGSGEPENPSGQSISRLFICNEGNFMYGNASLSVYNPDSRESGNQVFYNSNNFPLGDVLQSMTIVNGKGFLVVNNSGKVVVFDPNTYKYIATIKGLTSPRYVEQIDDRRVYITDLYSPSIAVVDIQTHQITGYIRVGRGTEQMARVGDYVYTTSWSFADKVYKIDTRSDKVVDSMTVTRQPNSITADKYGKLWVLSDGGYVGSPYTPEIAALTRIDGATMTVEAEYKFADINLSPSELTINGGRDTIYYINGGWGSSNSSANGVYRMSVTDNSLPASAFISENGALFYALGVDPVTSEVYVSDAIDYVQRGTVIRFDTKGAEIDRFRADITPGSFCFYRK